MRKRLARAALVLAAALASAPASSTSEGHDFELRVLSRPRHHGDGRGRPCSAGDPAQRPVAPGEAVSERRRHHVDTRAQRVDPHAHRHGDRPSPRVEHAFRRLERAWQRPADGGTDALEPPCDGTDVLRPAAAAFRLQDPDPAASGSRRSTIRQATACVCSRLRAIRRPHSWAGAGTAASARSWTSCTGRRRAVRALPAGAAAADMATTTTLDGRTVDFVVRRERGTINRFIYSYAMLAPPGDPADADTSLWNGRLVYTFDGGVAIGHSQGTLGGSASVDTGLSARATRSSTRAARARTPTTTSCSAARRRS